MLRRHDGRGWVDHPWETPDPDEVEESLRKLNIGATGSWFDCSWHLLIEIDPDVQLRFRAKQKAYLARYGRQGWYTWENREVSELDEAYREIGAIVEEENVEGGTYGIEDR